MIPRRYLFATLFIAAMLVLLAVVQAPRSPKEGGVGGDEQVTVFSLDSFETLAEFALRDGWSPRFEATVDPDQPEPWPFPGGFGAPWEPASPYLMDQGLALNGPTGESEVVLWRGLEWRRYRFQMPLVSARLEPRHGRLLLVTLRAGKSRYETRLLEVPEGRSLWHVDSGPWSRFSWDGEGVLLGLPSPEPQGAHLFASLPTDPDIPPNTVAAWDEPDLPLPPKNWIAREDKLWQAGQDLRGAKLLVPWTEDAHVWFPTRDRLWITSGGQWTLWGLQRGTWQRLDTGQGVLMAQPPTRMGRVSLDSESAVRAVSPIDHAKWTQVPAPQPPWPAFDPAWIWTETSAITAWDVRWGEPLNELPKERQREALLRVYRPEWKMATGIRASVAGWLPQGPEVAIRESLGIAWVWVGNRILLVRLQDTVRIRKLRSWLASR